MSETFYRYGGVFSPSDSIVAMYMAQIPWQDTRPNYPQIPMPIPSGPTPYTEANTDLEAILTAIFALKGSTAEIFNLKAQAFLIKAKLTNDGQQGT
jgi:hypothetical protein